jgi:hypothetical protein
MVDTMKQEHPSTTSRPVRHARRASEGPAADVSGLAALMVGVGAVALVGSQVLPEVALSGLQVRFFGLASLSIVIGLGLLLRVNWARYSAIGLFASVIYAQMSSRWLQSDLPGLFIDSLRGVHASGAPVVSLSDALPPASASAAALGLAFCLALGWFMARLQSAPVRAEFVPPRPGHAPRNKTVKLPI